MLLNGSMAMLSLLEGKVDTERFDHVGVGASLSGASCRPKLVAHSGHERITLDPDLKIFSVGKEFTVKVALT